MRISPTILRAPNQPIYLPRSITYSCVLAMRKLVPTYAGPLFKLYNQTSTATLDVYAGSDGKPYMGSYAAFAGSNVTTIQTIYDQTGNGNHAEQLTTAQQPVFRLTNGTFERGVYPTTFGYRSTGAPAKTALTVPNTLSHDRAAVTAISCGVMGGAFNLNSLMSLGHDATDFLSLYSAASKSAPNNFSIGAWGSTERNSNKRPLAGQPSVMAMRSNGTNTIVNLDSRQVSLGSQTTVTLTGMLLGGDNINAAYFGVYDGFAWVTCASSLSDADFTLVKSALDKNFNCQTRFTKQVVFDGDSLTNGNNTGVYNRSLIRQICEKLHGQGVATFNNGLSGQRMQTGTAMYPNRTNTSSLYDGTTYTKNVLVAHGGRNDIALNGSSAATVWGGLSPSQSGARGYMEAMRTAGFTIIFGTSFLGNDITGGEITELSDYNAFINANTADGYTIANYAGLPEMDYTNTTFFPDFIHPNEAGETPRANLLFPLIQTALA